MQKITPFLWFDDEAEDAMQFYVSVFTDSKILSVTRYGEAGPGPESSFMTGTFLLHSQEFTVLNGGPEFAFTPAISLMVHCKTQGEIDEFWEKLSAGGKPGQCGWLTDKFGVSWQVVPDRLHELLSGPDSAKAQRVMEAMLQMGKIEIGALEKAARQ